ncbi:MAG: type II and III secretion system protein family protein [Alphaproteobacteria bacterium]
MLLVAVLLPGLTPSAHAQNAVTMELQTSKHAGEFIVPLNKSQILHTDVPFTDLTVGNPAVADVLPLSNRTIYALGKALGSTNLTIYGKNRALIAVVDLVVSFDVDGLKRSLHENLPGERIDVRVANGSVVLGGTLNGAIEISRAVSIAERFAPKQVTNLLKVKGSQQVLLEVRVAEMKRTLAKELGFNVNSNYSTSNGGFTFNSGIGPAVDAFVRGSASVMTGGLSLLTAFDALEEKGLVKMLAEPNLVALSGDTASFLAGGEFPVPVAQTTGLGGTTITVDFKKFGVSLAFTPTVLGAGLINLVVAPEVSQIDRSISVSTGPGLLVPGLSVRRATTTIELRDGQSFAIAGLLQNDFQDRIRQFPWLGDVPVLGALFRSTDFQRNETELVIIVTPHLVRPAPAGTLAAPTDNFVPPSERDLFLFGKVETPEATPATATKALSSGAAGGLTGKAGHIVK